MKLSTEAGLVGAGMFFLLGVIGACDVRLSSAPPRAPSAELVEAKRLLDDNARMILDLRNRQSATDAALVALLAGLGAQDAAENTTRVEKPAIRRHVRKHRRAVKSRKRVRRYVTRRTGWWW